MLRVAPALLLTTLLLSGCDVQIIAAPPTPAPTAPPATPVPLPPGAANRLQDYVAGTRTLLAEFDREAPADSLLATTDDLLERSLALLPDYLEVHPQCQPYLAATLEVAMIWDSLSVVDINRDYLDEGVLPTSANTDPCKPMSELIIRPALLLALQAGPEVDRTRLRAEIAALGAHAETVKLRPEPTAKPGPLPAN